MCSAASLPRLPAKSVPSSPSLCLISARFVKQLTALISTIYRQLPQPLQQTEEGLQCAQPTQQTSLAGRTHPCSLSMWKMHSVQQWCHEPKLGCWWLPAALLSAESCTVSWARATRSFQTCLVPDASWPKALISQESNEPSLQLLAACFSKPSHWSLCWFHAGRVVGATCRRNSCFNERRCLITEDEVVLMVKNGLC